MMTTQALMWAQRMSGDMRIAGLSERTEAAYLRAVRQLSKFQRGRSPDELSADEVRDYLVWLRGEKRAAPGTLKIIPAGQRIPEVAGWVSAGEDSPGFLNKRLELGSARRCADPPHSRGPVRLRSDTGRSSATRVSNPLVLGHHTTGCWWADNSRRKLQSQQNQGQSYGHYAM